MITTTYTCDRCEHEQHTDGRQRPGPRAERVRQLYRISIGVNEVAEAQPFENPEALWCRNCVVETGLRPWMSDVTEPPKEPIKLEDLIRELVRDEVENP